MCETISTQPKGADHSQADQHLHVRLPVKAGPHTVAATFVKRPSLLLETGRQPYQAHFNMDRHPRITPAVYSITVNGPYEASGPGDTLHSIGPSSGANSRRWAAASAAVASQSVAR